MFKLILEHDYTKPKPAVDTSRFMQHGTVRNAAHSPDGREAGSGALRFFAPNSEVRVAAGPTWANLRSLAVQVWLKLDGLPGQRQNIIEGDNCFALFVDPGGAIVASFLGLVQGQALPQWNSVSTTVHAPGGIPVVIQPGAWTFITFVFDGIGRARIWLDDALCAVRTDFASGVGSVAPAGVVIGNWTLSNQYWLGGEIDSVRVWKEDPVAPLVQFYSRLRSDAERQAWDRFFDCLAKANVDRRHQLARLAGELARLQEAVIRGLYRATPEEREAFFALLHAYAAAWRDNTIGSETHAATLSELYQFVETFTDQGFAGQLHQLVDLMTAIFESELGECWWQSGIDSFDPEFAGFIHQASAHIPG